jgi:purine-nucleoside phosphorylase
MPSCRPFRVLGVGGHAGLLRAGHRRPPVMVLAGRKHAYETGEADGMKGAIRTLAAAGVKLLVQTNAAGSCDSACAPAS